jgi:hypothetical protein
VLNLSELTLWTFSTGSADSETSTCCSKINIPAPRYQNNRLFGFYMIQHAPHQLRPGRLNIRASILVDIGEDEEGTPVPARIVFVRDRRTKKWLALLSTELAISDEDIIKTYKRRRYFSRWPSRF